MDGLSGSLGAQVELSFDPDTGAISVEPEALVPHLEIDLLQGLDVKGFEVDRNPRKPAWSLTPAIYDGRVSKGNNRHRQQRTPADIHGRSVLGQTCCGTGSLRLHLASDEETTGSIRPSRQGFHQPTYSLIGSPTLWWYLILGAGWEHHCRYDSAVFIALGQTEARPLEAHM